MLLSFGLLFLVGISMAGICKKLKLPSLIGMLVSGIVLGPYVLDLLDPEILNISSQLREIALIIILIKAGLSLNIKDLKQVGRPAILMAFLPACFEITAYYLFAPMIFDISSTEALLMGTVLAAVSPAVIVPRMIKLIEEKYSTKKSIPQLILASASCDDVFVIVLFTTFTAMVSGEGASSFSLVEIPVSIIFGILAGAIIGFLLNALFEFFYKYKNHIKNSTKLIIILGVAFVLFSVEDLLKLPFSGLLSVISMACVYKFKAVDTISKDLAGKFSKLWIAAEILLFVLVGAAVDISYAVETGFSAILMIIIGLIMRSLGVTLCLVKTKFTLKERLFCVFSYLPKATVQAAIGAVALGLGLPCGDIILSVAVISILITAPLGAFAVDFSYKKLLNKDI